MGFSKRATKGVSDEIGGTAQPSDDQPAPYPTDASITEDDIDSDDAELYETMPPLPRKHSATYWVERLKLRQLAEERLIRLSDELLKLATEVRYLNPLVAEALDEAWISTDTALSLIEDE
jgi:hypothetical protein